MEQSTINNRTIFCNDNISILKGINSSSVDLIYLDPPFNKNKTFTAPIGSSAEGASFKDYFREEDLKDEWLQTIKEDDIELYNFLNGVKQISTNTHYLYNYCYLSYLAIRLIEMRRILRPTGSIYLHCDITMSHYIKLLMDVIFEDKHFRNEIVWCYSRPSAPKQKQLSRVHDTIFWYSNGDNWVFNADNIRQEYAKSSISREGYVANKSKMTAGSSVELSDKGKFPESWIYISPLKGNSNEYVGYPTQKPLALLERIIKASSNKGDLVLDPFCGCATTCVASEKLGRKWIGIDVSVEAYELVKERLNKEVTNPENLYQYDKEITFSTSLPLRTDLSEDEKILKKYVYIISNDSYPNEYKVGIASDVESRLNSYQTSSPKRDYKLEYKVHTHLFRETERHIHNIFENKHEWVRASLEEIKKEIENYLDL